VLAWLHGLPARVRNPATVTYRVSRRFFQPGFGITYSGAYWARELLLAPGAAEGSIEASRATAPDKSNQLVEESGTDALGPYRLRGSDVTPAPAVRNHVSLRLSHLSHAALDTRRMGWSAGRVQNVSGATDTPLDLVLRGDYRRAISVKGAPYARDTHSLTLHLAAGRFHVSVTPAPGCAVRPRSVFRIRQPRRGRVVRVDVYVGRKRVKTVRARRVRRVAVGRLPRRGFRLRIVATTSTGARRVSVRIYRRCGRRAALRARRGGSPAP
jgi:hypothetical protein